jgi:hypothetical protein
MRSFALLVILAGCSKAPSNAQHDAAIDAPVVIDAPGADFTLAVTTAEPRVAAGGSDVLAVAVTPQDGFDAAVTVAVPSPPPGVIVTNATIAAGATTGTLALVGDAGLDIGSAVTLHVVATAGAIEHAVDVVAAITALPGAPDPTFGGSGVVTLPLGTTSACNDLGIGSDGAITLIGQAVASSAEVGAIGRVLANGSADTAFAIVESDQGDPAAAKFACGEVTSDDGVVAGGTASDLHAGVANQAWLARFSFTGTEVTAFGSAGSDFIEPHLAVSALATTPVGAVVVL